MITEDYVSFETAKLLKEKGFDEKVDTFYKMDAEFLKSTLCINYNDTIFRLSDMHNIPENTVSAPTIQMAMKWLREVQQISVEVLPDWFDSSHTNIHDGWYCEVRYLTNMSYDADYFEHKKYDSYEEACEAAIKYCLENLI